VPSVHAASYEAILDWRSGPGRLAVQANPFHRVRLALERQYLTPGGYRRVVAQTEAVKADAVRLYGTPPQDVDVVELGFDPVAFSPARRAELRASSRAALRIDAQDKVIAFVANELERKGFATLTEALARLDDKNVKVLSIGRTDPEATRAWGLVIVEALATGIPVVTTRLAGAAQEILEGRTGALVDDPDDVAAFADGIAWALDPGGPEDGAAIADSVAHLTWETVLDRFTALLLRP
jgi:UDP-glucose:(heptosyl)LPS alpha-1,3-glucosyltransferase